VTGVEPTAQLVGRFSEPGAIAVPWPAVVAVLESAEMFWLSTVRPDGRPHVAPLPAMWLDGRVHFCTGADQRKAKKTSRRIPAVFAADGIRVLKMPPQAPRANGHAHTVGAHRPLGAPRPHAPITAAAPDDRAR
jgi:Pyridoxamine 5'-phosphate oxidase